jgi:hypothetical protein
MGKSYHYLVAGAALEWNKILVNVKMYQLQTVSRMNDFIETGAAEQHAMREKPGHWQPTNMDVLQVDLDGHEELLIKKGYR